MRDTGAVLVALLALGAGGVRAELTVTTDFEGGSAVVDAIDRERREVHVRPGGDPLRGWPCWWYLRIDGLTTGATATVVVRGSERPARNNGRDTGRPLAAGWALPDRAAVSHDGTTWTQTGPGVREGDRVAYPLTGTDGPTWIAWGPPFTSRECDDLLEQAVAAAPRQAEAFALALSR